jgi:aspartate aminotransferase
MGDMMVLDISQRNRQTSAAMQPLLGFLFPNALLQHALGDLEQLSIDMGHYQQKRDVMLGALLEMGYEVHRPEGTFYLLPRSPIADDTEFCRQLAQHGTLVLPGNVVELPGYFRISLTASDDMIRRALPAFEAVLHAVRTG